ncbi:hypothetical protein [Pusillimonas minor]|uniref:hypothetical protein n=1 Tax=Pusillimonas minor TaxID=2697024 RepID=UPI0020174B63|nr:hypothetical protein [Pusillimonas minor]
MTLRLRDLTGESLVGDNTNMPLSQETATISPDDRLEQALAELRESTASELLESLLRVSPGRFEVIVLVDGVRLVNLMMDNEVGVSSRTFRVPTLDSDYFDED